MTPTELGTALLALFAVFYWRGIFATVTAALGLFAVVLIGTSGWVGRALVAVTSWTQHTFGTIFTNAFGAFSTAILTIVFGVIFLHGMHPKNSATRGTAWAGVALGALIVATATGIPALSGLRSDITQFASGVLHL